MAGAIELGPELSEARIVFAEKLRSLLPGLRVADLAHLGGEDHVLDEDLGVAVGTKSIAGCLLRLVESLLGEKGC